MNRYIVTIAIGPVQNFIAAAKRTRDLWYGSFILSTVSHAVAVHIHQIGTKSQLVFPALKDEQLLLVSPDPANAPRVVNHITAIVETDDASTFVANCKKAARDRLVEIASECLSALGDKDGIDVERFCAQIEDALEIYAAWAPYPDGGDYKHAADSANRLLAARKSTRNFVRFIGSGDIELSSLDGQRESVIGSSVSDSRKRDQLRRHLRLDQTEHLDALGLIKCVNGKAIGFPAVARVALQPWIAKRSERELKALSVIFEKLMPAELASKINFAGRGNQSSLFATFPYDCELLLKPRLQAKRREIEGEPNSASAIQALNELEALLFGEQRTIAPPPEDGVYVAMLLADGDRMGDLLDNKAILPEVYRAISETLSSFAQDVDDIVERHGGACIYAGGDDVLALLPVTGAIGCARELANEFRTRMAPHAQGMGLPADKHPTLSVGIAFGHVLSPMASLREDARLAERLAKDGDGNGLRNALAIRVQPRGGAPVMAVGRWDEAPAFKDRKQGFDVRLAGWLDKFSNGWLSKSSPYELRVLAGELHGGALVAEANRLVARRTRKDGDFTDRETLDAINAYLQDASRVTAHVSLADEWYIARWLLQRYRNLDPTQVTDLAQEAA